MLTLTQLQQTFYDSVIDKSNHDILKYMHTDHINAMTRLNIYRNTVTEKLRRALEITYPAIWDLLDVACANSVAYAFLQEEKNLPETACLDDWGDHFPEFLRTFQPLEKMVYLCDVAKIQWYMHLSYCGTGDEIFHHYCAYHLEAVFHLLENPQETAAIDIHQKSSYCIISRCGLEVRLTFC